MIFQNFGFNQYYPIAAAPEPAPTIQRLAVSSSLYAYYDVAFTASYSGSGQTTIFDLSGNNKSGSVVGTMNYNTSTISGSVLRLGSSSNGNRVDMPQLTLGAGQTWVLAWFMTSANYTFNGVEPFVGRDPEGYGIFAQNNAGGGRTLPVVNDVATVDLMPLNSGQSGSWHISQFSFNDTTNTVNWCMDGTTGSYTLSAAVGTGTLIPKFNNNSGARTLNSGSMMQVMALYTGSLTTSELLQNHNSLKGRYGLA
jgi:hypothetical protein